MLLTDITKKVRVIMNEAGEEESFHLLSEDTVKLNMYIESVIPDAINLVMSVAPLRHLNTSLVSSATNSGECSRIELPADFLRLAAVKLKSWKRAVDIAYPFGGEEYKIQHNQITRSGVNKPSCVFAYSAHGVVVECFPAGELEYCHYVKSAALDRDKGVNLIKDELFTSVCYMCASLVYSIFENANTSEKLKVIAIESIPKE